MRTYLLTHVSDEVLIRNLHSLVVRERATTAAVLAHVAEIDARRLYLPAGYPSMHAYCVGELRLSEDAAYKRIQAARAARDFPTLFTALAEGRIHLAGVCLLATHLTSENADELLAAATHRTKSEIEALIARRFPRTELLPLVQAIPARSEVGNGHAAGDIATQLAPGQVHVTSQAVALKPHAAGRFALQMTVGAATYEKLQYAQALLSHAIPSGDTAEILDRALDTLIAQLEKRKFAATRSPRPRQCDESANVRHIPAHVKRAVWHRDRGQCTFVGENGRRCGARRFLEFDHVRPVARGGEATVEGMRLRCRGHNQHEAERVFGAGFMEEKREQARRATEEARTEKDLTTCLRELGFRAGEIRRAIEACGLMNGTTLEERARHALKFLCPTVRRMEASPAAVA